ncbi:NYN domain-containing protein [Candidatus Haliotispira prima]|uniref:NYN domain-containing protein n=1 Tax=Candidatus Haliotispira prima TaxID=3034016 RepID=A0ABY8MHB7_9SPIO|nr:NYN domain-containing protein [Candidatus Haliotispira prima]
MIKTVTIVDGGYFKKVVVTEHKLAHRRYTDFLYDNIRSCEDDDEDLMRILYYDCLRYEGEQQLPISGDSKRFYGNPAEFDGLASYDLMAIRLGELRFRGFILKQEDSTFSRTLGDSDFLPSFEQKGVDMRIGLDIAHYSEKRLVDRIILISNDTDCIPAMKEARKNGVQIVVVEFEGQSLHRDLVKHSDYVRWREIIEPNLD